jgi:hypothetical protein
MAKKRLHPPHGHVAHRKPRGEIVAKIMEAEAGLDAFVSPAPVDPLLAIRDPMKGIGDPRAIPLGWEQGRRGIIARPR